MKCQKKKKKPNSKIKDKAKAKTSQLQGVSAHFVSATFTSSPPPFLEERVGGWQGGVINLPIEMYTYKFTNIAIVQRKEQQKKKKGKNQPTRTFWITYSNSMLLWVMKS